MAVAGSAGGGWAKGLGGGGALVGGSVPPPESLQFGEVPKVGGVVGGSLTWAEPLQDEALRGLRVRVTLRPLRGSGRVRVRRGSGCWGEG